MRKCTTLAGEQWPMARSKLKPRRARLGVAPVVEKAKARTGESWTPEEHARLLEGLEIHGRQWKLVTEHVGTRTYKQTVGHGHFYLRKVEREGEEVPAAAREKEFERWTPEEHARFLEGFGIHGRQWKLVAQHVGTKTHEQTHCHGKFYVKKLEREGEEVPAAARERGERWTPEEHARFLEGLEIHGRQWKLVAEHVGTKTHKQTQGHGERYMKKLEREGKAHLIPPLLGKGGRPKKVRTEAQQQHPHHHHEQPVALTTTASTRSGDTIRTSADCDDDSGDGSESILPTSMFLEETSGTGPSDMTCDDAAPAAVSSEEVELDLEQVESDLVHLIRSIRKRKRAGVAG